MGYEGEAWREASWGKSWLSVSLCEILYGLPKSKDEQTVGLAHFLSSFLSSCMKPGSRRVLEVLRPFGGSMGEDRMQTDGSGAIRLVPCLRPGFDHLDNRANPLVDLTPGEVSPARQRRKDDSLVFCEILLIYISSPSGRAIKGTSVVPDSDERGPFCQSGDAVSSGPVFGPRDEILFDSMAQEVGESVELSALVGGDWDCVIAAAPESSTPAVEALNLAGEFGLEISHEFRQVFGVPWSHKKVEVIGSEGECVDWHGAAALGTAESAEDK